MDHSWPNILSPTCPSPQWTNSSNSSCHTNPTSGTWLDSRGANGHRAGPTKHPKFYCTDPSLTDGVIIQVHCGSISLCLIITPMYTENTLYRLSFHGLARGSHFFTSTFSINNGGLREGSPDEHPIVLPETITCNDFEAYPWYDVRLVYFNWYWTYTYEIFMQIWRGSFSRVSHQHHQHFQKLVYSASLWLTFNYFRCRFIWGWIHLTIVLGIAQKHGIPDLVGPAVKALAKPDIPLVGWCTNPEILHHITLWDVTKISWMKESSGWHILCFARSFQSFTTWLLASLVVMMYAPGLGDTFGW